MRSTLATVTLGMSSCADANQGTQIFQESLIRAYTASQIFKPYMIWSTFLDEVLLEILGMCGRANIWETRAKAQPQIEARMFKDRPCVVVVSSKILYWVS